MAAALRSHASPLSVSHDGSSARRLQRRGGVASLSFPSAATFSSSSSSSFFGDLLSLQDSWGKHYTRMARGDADPRRRFDTTINSVLTDVSNDFMTLQPQDPPQLAADPKTVASIILGGGAGTRLFPLTRMRAKPAVPIGGGYRLIDVPMSNCINSGIKKIYVLTQFNSQSLNRHLARAYNLGDGVNFGDGFVEVLAATQTPGEDGKRWFQGTADAVRQFVWLFEDAKLRHIENILILSGDHLYRMDYMDFLQKHIVTGADISVSCVPVDNDRASDYGLVKIDGTGRIHQFLEKPKGESLKTMQVDTTVLGLSPEDAKNFPYIASMGIYLFKTDVLLKLLRWRYPHSNDFGSEIIPKASEEYNVQAYLFNGYWEDIGTIKSFFDANLALADQPSKFHFYDPSKPIFTSPRFLPPSKIERSRVLNSIVSHGCFLRECTVEHSIVGVRSRLERGAELVDTMMMGADYYQTEAEIASFLAEGKVPVGSPPPGLVDIRFRGVWDTQGSNLGCEGLLLFQPSGLADGPLPSEKKKKKKVPVGVGRNTKIRSCIIDKNAKIGKDVVIANADNVEEAERPSEGFYIRSGITVVTQNATIPDGTII